MSTSQMTVLAILVVLVLGIVSASADTVRWDGQQRQFELVRDSGDAWLSQGRLCVVLGDKTRISTDDPHYQVFIQAKHGENTFVFTKGKRQLDMTLVAKPAGEGAITIKAVIANRGGQPLSLDRIELLSGKLLGQRDPAKPGVLVSGMCTGLRPKVSADGVWESHYTLALQSPCLAAGFLTGLHNTNRFTLRPNLDLIAWGECNGVQLPAGQLRETDTLFVSTRPNPLKEMERFADLAAQVNHVRLWPTNMATWCSWYSGWITDKAGSLQQGLEKGVEENIAPVKKLALQRDATASYAMRICEDYSMFGDWNDITVHIPHGLTCLARLIDEAGIVPGVWYVPCWVSLNSRVRRDHPEWMAKGWNGTEVRHSLKDYGPIYKEMSVDGEVAVFDPSNPQVIAYFEQMASQWRKRGFRYVTNDYLGTVLFLPKYQDPTKTKAEVLRACMEATRKGLGDDIFYRTIGPLYGPSMGLSQDMRVGLDSGGNVTSAYEIVGSLWFYNHRIWLNDPESIVVRGNGLEWSTTWASWIALAGTVMTYGDRLGELSEEGRNLYHRIFPPLNAPGRPLDMWENEPFLLWGMAPGEADGPYELFGVFELAGAKKGEVSLNLDEISARSRGWKTPTEAPSQYLIWDFWQQRLLSSEGSELRIPMPSKSGRLFALRARLPRPQLLSTSGHFSQGLLETSDIRWNAKTAILSGKVQGNGGDETTLYFHVPVGMKLVKAKLGETVHRSADPQPNVVAITVPATAKPVEFSLAFVGKIAEKTTSRPFAVGPRGDSGSRSLTRNDIRYP